jgi:malate dehydrogenase (quinone)
VGTYLFAQQVRKIVPSVSVRDLSRAKGFGGMRLQRVDTRSRELLLGEGKIIGDNIIFNMAPSPGASVCLYNAMRDAETIGTFFPSNDYVFDKQRLLKDLYVGPSPETPGDISLQDMYAA